MKNQISSLGPGQIAGSLVSPSSSCLIKHSRAGFLRRLSLLHSVLQGQHFNNSFFLTFVLLQYVSAGMTQVGLATVRNRKRRINNRDPQPVT